MSPKILETGSFRLTTIAATGTILVGLTLTFFILPAAASATSKSVCSNAAQKAAAATGVPLSVLLAITLAETGRTKNGQFGPWPWTVNSQGIGKWFDSPTQAIDFARRERASGKTSFDVGCFQLNYRWHGNAFQSIEHMFEPGANALYAANFLKELFAETGSWPDAAAFYHSRTPEYAAKYRARFSRIFARLDGGGGAPPAPNALPVPPTSLPPVRARVNSFPLLFAGQEGTSTRGSLFPVQTGAVQPFFGHR